MQTQPAIQETHQDWRVTCMSQNDTLDCVALQDQTRQNGERLLAMEIRVHADGTGSSLLVLPFGILLQAGVTPIIDDRQPMEAVPFTTCLPAGCVVRMSIASQAMQELRGGTRLNLHAVTIAEEQLSFTVSLNGLTAATDRIGELVGH